MKSKINLINTIKPELSKTLDSLNSAGKTTGK